MPLRLALLLLFTGLVAGCVSSGHDSPLRTDKGRDEARVAYVQLGLGYLRQGMSEQAKVPLKKALELDADDADANAALALVFQAQAEPELADRYFHKALASRPADPRLLNNYGSFLFEQQRYDLASRYFQQAAADTLYPLPAAFAGVREPRCDLDAPRSARQRSPAVGKSPAPEQSPATGIARNG